jgi:hypothetical protein
MRFADRRFFTVVVIGTVSVLAAACSSGTSKTAPAPTSTSIPRTTVATAPTPTRPRGSLEFREVEYTGLNPLFFPASERPCVAKRLSSVAPAIPGTVLFDRKHQYCYFVGAVLLTGAGIVLASVVYDPTQSAWAVNLHFDNNDFLTKIAGPLVDKELAIVLNGVVQSAPDINPGIAGRDIEITGDYSRAEAINVAASIIGIAPSRVKVDASGSPAGVCNTMDDASKAASAVFYANNVGAYPKTFGDMENGNPRLLDLSLGATGTGTVLTGNGWKLTMTGGGTTMPTFTCAVGS